MHKLVILLAILLFSCGEKNSSNVEEIKRVEIKFKHQADMYFSNSETDSIHLQIELATTDFEKETGLMYRASMESNQGMLFVYENERMRPGFYMKNTHIALDLLYLNKNFEVVDVYENAQPFNEKSIPSKARSQYVLEVNAGFVKEHQVQLGDSFVFSELKK